MYSDKCDEETFQILMNFAWESAKTQDERDIWNLRYLMYLTDKHRDHRHREIIDTLLGVIKKLEKKVKK
jgi:hypothetical protein